MTPSEADARTRYLLYHLYISGQAGLSNLVMSLELGVVLAHLSGRTLLLEGNASPSANVVDYDGALPESRRSLVTDLLEVPVEWREAHEVELVGQESREWIPHSLTQCVFYFPPEQPTTGLDARSFARGRRHFFTHGSAEAEVPVLRLSGGEPVGPQRFRAANFGFYSYFFYLDEEVRRRVHGLLRKMTPKPAYAELVSRIVSDLGDFNAVHVRRGDFKYTVGVTTRIRRPEEVLEALAPHFAPDAPLVILTDDDRDPFFDAILRAYPKALFLDRFILEHHREALLSLPRHDPIALAFVAQHVASHSRDFVGSLNSTFTALVQRHRGNAGREERFKFLWNELPDPEAKLGKGEHPISDCVPMENGVMVEEYLGPYSWNRVNPRLQPAWMREWPEAFLDEPE